MEEVDARDLEAALAEVNSWKVELVDEAMVQQRIDWLDKRMEVVDSSTSLYRRAFRHFRTLCSRSKRLPTSCLLSKDSLRKEGDHPLHQTALSDVYIGWYDALPVALKSLRIHGSDRKKVEKAFYDEVSTWRCLRHPHIVPFLGVSDILPSCLVSEWMEYGDIASFFRMRPDENRLSYIQQIATGVSHIHSLELVHGDLKATNILINSKTQACISDFGLTVVLNNTASASASAASGGTVRWMAPELLLADGSNPHAGRPTTSSDIYALGLVMWELFTGRVPFDDVKVALSYKIVLGTRPGRPSLPSNIGFSAELWALMQRCWEQNPDRRPSCSALERALTPNAPDRKRSAYQDTAENDERAAPKRSKTSVSNLAPIDNKGAIVTADSADLQHRIDRLDQQLSLLDPSEDLFFGGLNRLQALCTNEPFQLPSSYRLRSTVVVDSKPYSVGELLTLFRGRCGSKLVAVKRFNSDSGHQTLLKDLEIIPWKHLSHPNIVPFLGTCDAFPFCLVNEWMTHGNVISFLGRNSWEARVTLVKDVLSGLEFLHTHGIVHGNLKASNVLIDRARRARLADGGQYITVKLVGKSPVDIPDRWLAPELIVGGEMEAPKATLTSDMYSVAMVIWAIFNNRLPFGQLRDHREVTTAVLAGKRPEWTAEARDWGMTEDLWLLINQCWRTDPQDRPSCPILMKEVNVVIGL